MVTPVNDVQPGNGKKAVKRAARGAANDAAVEAMQVLASELTRANDLNQANIAEQKRLGDIFEAVDKTYEKHYTQLQEDYKQLRQDYVDAKTKKNKAYDEMLAAKDKQLDQLRADHAKALKAKDDEITAMRNQLKSTQDKVITWGMKIVEALLIIVFGAKLAGVF